MERYLRKCLISICVDDRNLFETLDVLVINDGSTDGTSAIAHEFADRYPSVFRVIDKPNGHYGSCVNRGLIEATGYYIKILDADDCFDRNEFTLYLRDLNRIKELSPPVDLVLTHVNYVDANDRQSETIEYPFGGRSDLTLDDVSSLSRGRFIHGYTYRRAIFDGLNYHQSEGVPYTDTEWIFLPTTRVKRVAHSPRFVYRYLIGREGQSCAPAVLSRQLTQIRKCFDVRLEQYKRFKANWSSAAIRYAEAELTGTAGYLYVTYIQYGYWRFRTDLHSLDQTVANDLRDIKKAIGTSNVLFPNSPFHVCYGKLCAEHPFLRPIFSLAFQLKRIAN